MTLMIGASFAGLQGTLFLWMFWPSFNSALIQNEVERKVAVYNTYFASAASAVAAFALSIAASRDGKLSMVRETSPAFSLAAPLPQPMGTAMVKGGLQTWKQ